MEKKKKCCWFLDFFFHMFWGFETAFGLGPGRKEVECTEEIGWGGEIIFQWRGTGPVSGGQVGAHLCSVILFTSLEGLQFSTCCVGHSSLNLQMCVFGRKLKPHVPNSFTCNSSQCCFVMILWCSKRLVALFNGLMFSFLLWSQHIFFYLAVKQLWSWTVCFRVWNGKPRSFKDTHVPMPVSGSRDYAGWMKGKVGISLIWDLTDCFMFGWFIFFILIFYNDNVNSKVEEYNVFPGTLSPICDN